MIGHYLYFQIFHNGSIAIINVIEVQQVQRSMHQHVRPMIRYSLVLPFSFAPRRLAGRQLDSPEMTRHWLAYSGRETRH